MYLNTTALGDAITVGTGVHSATRHAVVALSGQWGRYVLQLAALVVFSRLLTPADVGLVAMVTAVVGIAYVIGDFGLSLAALQAQDLDARHRSNLFWWNAAIGLVVGAGVVALAVPLAALYDDPRVAGVTVALAPVFVANGLGVQFRTELTLRSRYGVIAGADVVGQLVAFVAAIGVVLLGGGYWALVVLQIVAALVTNAVLVARAGWWPGRYHRDAPMRALLRFGGHTFASQIVNYVSTNIDQVLVGRVWGAGILGFYSRAFQVARIPAQQMAAPLTRVALPYLARVVDDPVRYRGAVRRIQLALSTLLVGVLALVAGTADRLVPVAFGPGWDAVVPLVRILCVAGAVQAIGYVVYWVLLSHGRTGILLWTESGARLVMIALMIAAVGIGPAWVAAAAVIGQVLLVVSSVVVALPRVGLDATVLLPAARPTVAFAAAAGAAGILGAVVGGVPDAVVLLAQLALFAAVSGAFLALAAYRRDVRELAELARTIRRPAASA